MSDLVPVARYLPYTVAEGPGPRTAVWVQGCTIRCPGCFNPHMWGFTGGDPVPAGELAARIVAEPTGGVTFLGGEPFDHAGPLAAVAARVRAADRTVMTFTGYTLARLRGPDAPPAAADLLAATDLLVAGPFDRDRLDVTRPWVGSTNQEFVLLNPDRPELLDGLGEQPDRVEIEVDAAGRVSVNGWARLDDLDRLLADLPVRPARRTDG
ncbi:4Fe-4S single cluster domain-containing protein [Polymorphospora rubra]|uniref:4Fe-4S single cluster domain-containing protein n=1 Tax=Polymorphospora rubra TaxID=338584 RepID=UPI0033F69BF3